MATVMERTLPGSGRQVVLIGLVGLLVGGIAGGLVGMTFHSDEKIPALAESAPAITGAPVIDIEAVRAQNYQFRAPAPGTDIEAVRAQNYVARAKSQ